MINPRNQLELLAPAKTADFGIEAIQHGADAVYIGGPAFGARANAGNTVADIERLARHAHRFDARVLVALNTILRDDELEAARQLVWQVFDAGADALELNLYTVSADPMRGASDIELEHLAAIEAVRLAQAEVAGSFLVEVNDAGHSAFLEAPTQFNDTILSLLQMADHVGKAGPAHSNAAGYVAVGGAA